MNKRREILEKHFKKFSKEIKDRPALQKIKVKSDGTFIFGSPHRAVKAFNTIDPIENDFYIDNKKSRDLNFPSFEKVFDNIGVCDDYVLPVKDLKNIVHVCNLVVHAAEISIDADKISLKKISNSSTHRNGANMWESASCLFNQTVEPINFVINTDYLKDMLILFNQLKCDQIILKYPGPDQPLLFVSHDLNYIVMPQRLNGGKS